MLVSFYLETCWKTLIWAHTLFPNVPQFPSPPPPPKGILWIFGWEYATVTLEPWILLPGNSPNPLLLNNHRSESLSMLSLLLNWVVGKFKFVYFYFFFEWQCMLSIVLNKIFNKLISFLEIDTLILDLNYLICVPHPIVNCLNTILFTALFP